jgi:hypothetical protein
LELVAASTDIHNVGMPPRAAPIRPKILGHREKLMRSERLQRGGGLGRAPDASSAFAR